MGARVGWAEFDAQDDGGGAGELVDVRVGWAEFDALAAPYGVCVGWAELDCQSPTSNPVPPYSPGGGVTRYHSYARQDYEIPVAVDEAEEENIIMQILMEIAAHELL